MKGTRFAGLIMIAAGIAGIWLPVWHIVTAGVMIFLGVLILATTSRRVHIDPPGKRNRLK